jgi:hypothetical protein
MKRIAGFIISTLFLAACGGGGSTPPATPPIQTQAVQRAIAAQSLATIESAQIAYEYLPIYTVSPEPAVSRRGIHTAALQAVAGWHGSTTSSQRHIAAAPATPYSACYDGVESTLVESAQPRSTSTSKSSMTRRARRSTQTFSMTSSRRQV